MQTVTLQFGAAARPLAHHFWNAQDALLRWAEYGQKDGAVDPKTYFTTATDRQPRMVSVEPAGKSEIVGECGSMGDCAEPCYSTVANARPLFPDVSLNKKSVQTLPEHWQADGDRTAEQDEDILDAVRYFAEDCDRLEAIQTFAANDQFGRYGATIAELLADEYAKTARIVFSIPSAADWDCSWDAKALLLYSYAHSVHVPFAQLVREPADVVWSVDGYERASVFAASIDALMSSADRVLARAAAAGSIESVAFGMEMGAGTGCKIRDRLCTAIDLTTMAAPSLDQAYLQRSVRGDAGLPVYIKVTKHGYIPHSCVAELGKSVDLSERLLDISRHVGKSSSALADRQLRADIVEYLLDQADRWQK